MEPLESGYSSYIRAITLTNMNKLLVHSYCSNRSLIETQHRSAQFNIDERKHRIL